MVIDFIFYYFFPWLLVRSEHAPHGFPPYALFRWRVRRHTVSIDALPESTTMRLLLVFLPRRRVSSWDRRGRGGDRLKTLATFLSLLHIQVRERPPSCVLFHFGPCNFNFFLFPDFWYISFDFVRLGPPIGINSMSIFQFGPPSFNFRIGLKKMNLFGTVVSISSFLSFD